MSILLVYRNEVVTIMLKMSFKKNFVIAFAFVCSISTSVVMAREGCKLYDISTDCPSVKQEISLNTGCTILHLDESFESTYKILQNSDIRCHLELETLSKDYGFHIYFDELKIDTDPVYGDNSSPNCKEKCIDSVQFARDWGVFDTHHSCLYCGHRKKLNYATASNADYHNAHKQEAGFEKRLYVESIDKEMDVYFKINSRADKSPNAYNRTIRIVATVFKKSCARRDDKWKQCPHSKQCVKKDFFCDGLPNCAWPYGNFPTDEIQCDGYVTTFERFGSRTMASRIPVIIIVSIIGIGCTMLLIVVVRKCLRVYRVFQQPARKPSDDEEDEEAGVPLQTLGPRTQSNERNPTDRSNSTTSNQQANEIRPSNHSASPREDQAVLPTYDEAVQSPYVPNIRYADDIEDRGDPPPYSPEMT